MNLHKAEAVDAEFRVPLAAASAGTEPAGQLKFRRKHEILARRDAAEEFDDKISDCMDSKRKTVT